MSHTFKLAIMKFTSITVFVTLTVLIANLGGIYTAVTPGPGYVYIAAERTPNNNGDTGYFKVGGANINMPQNVKRTKLNTGNPRHLAIRQYIQVTRTRAAETAAHRALQQWCVNLGGGREWFMVNANNWNNFLARFNGALNQYLPNNNGQRNINNRNVQ